jgi:hypothetical protein
MPTYVGKIPTAPVVVADATVLDEKGLLGLTTAYQALGLIIDLVPVTGHPDRARKLAAIDNAAYGALLTARSAYKTGNATSYKKALDEGNATINRGIALIRGSRPN